MPMKPFPTLRGIQDLITFLNWLDGNNISYDIKHERDDTIMVVVTVVTARIEVDFFDDHIEFNWYSGDESIHDDQDQLFKLIRDNWE
jgi:hypothetical protein